MAVTPTTPSSQNLNASPSPGGDGVQSSQSERAAAGLDANQNQPGQQRVNAAERREHGEQAKPGQKAGERANLIQSPGEVLPTDATAERLAAAEQARNDAAFAERNVDHDDLPESTRAEMEAGRNALGRGNRNRAANPTNPVDGTSTQKA